jgi:hypothetical protein
MFTDIGHGSRPATALNEITVQTELGTLSIDFHRPIRLADRGDIIAQFVDTSRPTMFSLVVPRADVFSSL